MAAPSMVTRSGDSLIVRSVVSGDTLFGTEVKEDTEEFNYYDPSDSEADGECEEDDEELPQCKVKRNYSCPQCEYYTQNPRFYLYHQKQVHNHKIKIYECEHCLYASKHSQKLQRHVHMVHVMGAGKRKEKTRAKVKSKLGRTEASSVVTPSEIYEMEEQQDDEEPTYDENGAQIFKCSVCDMTSKNRVMVARHERLVHLKKKFYRCSKCNYVTHMKARYTKHVKYHSMPMIKCDLCDFRTPYKWNLDRHNKNHTGDGPFRCSICNFTAEIKQSLTVHEMNHHIPPVGHLVMNNNNRRRLKVGASDTMGLVTEEDQIEQSELELLRLEREGGAYDQNPADFVQAQLDIPNDSVSGSETPSGSGQFAESGRPHLIQIQKYSCKACDFKGNLGEVQRHEQEKHQITGIFPEKKKRPIPNLIPIQTQKPLTRQSAELTKENVNKFCGNGTVKDFTTLVNEEFRLKEPSQSTRSKSPDLPDNDKKTEFFKKKNASFFDKLKEKLMTSANIEGTLTCTFCGHEAKCLSEHMKHQKSHIPGERDDQSESSSGSQGTTSAESSSTRCQHCRHRCKSSADLIVHLQTCKDAPVPIPMPAIKVERDESRDEEEPAEEGPHPMENKVFIWNNLTENSHSYSMEDTYTRSDKSSINPPVKPFTEEKAFVGIEVKPGYGTTTNDGQEETITSKDVNTKKVFKCPHCSFWASTASRFHVHIVGHLNKRPFQCSLCHYSSNWRWDITKHIRLKTIRDPSHEKAKVLLTDETGRRNYSKYNKYLTTMKMENQQAPKLPRRILPKDGVQPSSSHTSHGSKRPTDSADEYDSSPKKKPHVENKKTMWKCKKCYFRDNDREVVLEHVRDHYRNAAAGAKKKKNAAGKANSSRKDDETGRQSEVKAEPDVSCPEFMCETCPFTCTSWNELEAHSEKHFVCTVNGKQFKCRFCSFYAQDNDELSAHLDSHGDAENSDYSEGKSAHACLLCPYVAINKTQLVFHRKRHDSQSDSLHKCYKCSYGAPNNTILALHVRLHGRHNSDGFDGKITGTIKLPADISKIDTTSFPDIPMVWVSKPMGISKMFKCRFCPHINMRKSNIQEHEKMHKGAASPSSGPQHKCPDCNYICNNAGVLSAHFKVHQALYGQIVGVVDSSKADDEQISEMKERLNQYERILNSKDIQSGSSEIEETPPKGEREADERILRFCNVCPARFLFEKEMKIHMRFHELKLLFKCESCTYTARQKQHLEAHYKVHTDEYQERTNVLTEVYDTDPNNPRPKIAAVYGCKDSRESVWVVLKNEDEDSLAAESKERLLDSNNKTHGLPKQFTCTKCPAEFFKSVALSYHETLHGGPGPHKCKFCDYAVKTYGNLIRHEAVHKGQSPKKFKTEVPSSGTELYKQKTEAAAAAVSKSPAKSPPPMPLPMDPEFGILIHGSPEFIYPTYLKNGKPKEKRYKCHRCPSAFEKREQYKIHLSLHGSKQRYSCERCDYSVKYYANYTQHVKKHDMCDASHKERKLSVFSDDNNEEMEFDEADGYNGMKRSSFERGSKTMKMSTADQQSLMIMQTRNLANSSMINDKEIVSRCPYCPYTNNRKDGVSSHIRCHSNPRGGPYVCKFCDYTVPQLHFLRDHMKVHFNLPKFVKPDAYMKVEHMEIWAEPLDPAQNEEKFLVFKDQGEKVKDDRFLPKVYRPDLDNMKGRVYINLRTGEEEIELDEEDEQKENERNHKVNGDVHQEEDDEEYTKQRDTEDDYDESSNKMDVESDNIPNGDIQDGGGTDYSKFSTCSDSECSEMSLHSKPALTSEPREDAESNKD
uniref:C2H2-type domain-containing protein n=1 Tax=Lygus hesperus TaxID=30085 RepID=A0A0A9X010_LYGHE